MIKLNENLIPRGWSALKEQLEQEGLKECEIEEAEASFRNGMEILAKLFYSRNSIKNKQ